MTAQETPTILTPEHVPVRLFVAGLGSRFLALLADFFLLLAICAAGHVLLSLVLPGGLRNAVWAAGVFAATWSYHVFFEVRRRGQTPGKRFCGLRVVDRRGLPISFQQSFVRNILRALDFAPLFYGVGGTASLLDRFHRRLGDIAADTLVIHERKTADPARQLAGMRRFNSLRTPDVQRRIRHLISLEEREFLLALCLRAERLEPKARFDLMEAAGNRYRQLLGVDDPHLSGENLVRDLTAILFSADAGADRIRRSTVPSQQ